MYRRDEYTRDLVLPPYKATRWNYLSPPPPRHALSTPHITLFTIPSPFVPYTTWCKSAVRRQYVPLTLVT